MSLVTPSNVSERKGWKVTPMGRMVRPIKMRPDRPLPPPTLGRSGKGKDGNERRKRVREPDVRARRRTIDPTKWDSVLLKGMFLDMISGDVQRGDGKEKETVFNQDRSESEGKSESGYNSDGRSRLQTAKSDAHDVMSNSAEPCLRIADPVSVFSLSLSPLKPSPTLRTTGSPGVSNANVPDLIHEKSASLSLLRSLFGSKDDDWGGKESVGSDISEEEVERLMREGGRVSGADAGEAGGGKEVEEVSMHIDNAYNESVHNDQVTQEPQQIQDASKPESVVEQQNGKPVQKTKLKDMFAPREEDGSSPFLLILYPILDTIR